MYNENIKMNNYTTLSLPIFLSFTSNEYDDGWEIEKS